MQGVWNGGRAPDMRKSARTMRVRNYLREHGLLEDFPMERNADKIPDETHVDNRGDTPRPEGVDSSEGGTP